MNNPINGKTVGAIIGIIVVALAVFAYARFSGDGKGGKPAAVTADPQLNRMYSPPGGASRP